MITVDSSVRACVRACLRGAHPHEGAADGDGEAGVHTGGLASHPTAREQLRELALRGPRKQGKPPCGANIIICMALRVGRFAVARYGDRWDFKEGEVA